MSKLNLAVFVKLPRFTVASIHASEGVRFLRGSMDARWPADCRLGTLYELKYDELIDFDFTFKSDKDGAVLEVAPYNAEHPLASGQSYFCSRWKLRAMLLIADQQISWRRRVFQPQDAWSYRTEQGRETLAPGSVPPPNARDIRLDLNGWDHEHCEFCWASISLTTFPRAFLGLNKSGKDAWVCKNCYESIVLAQNPI